MLGSNDRKGPGYGPADLERFFSLSADMLCISGVDGYFHYVNAAWERTLGWTVDEMLSHPWTFFVHPDDLDRSMAESLKQTEQGLPAIKFDNRYRTKDGSYVWLRWNSRPSVDHGEMHAMARDVTAQKEAELALKAANESLERSNAELETFAYSAAHDLKEPLRSLQAFSQILLDDYAEKLDDDGRDYLNRLAMASARLKLLVEDLLAISRAGGHAVEEHLDLGAVVAEIVGAIGVMIRERNATIEVSPGLPHVLANGRRTGQVFHNLITNAIKFNRGGAPRVEIGSLVTEAGETALFVRDNGIGIAPEYHEKIFGVFQRLQTREEFEGTGAGLAIAKRAVESMGGRIWVESSPDDGTTFLFTLPLATVTATRAA